MKNTTSKTDVIWGYINIIISMGANFIMLPFIIRFLSDSSLGLWYVFTSFGAFGNMFDFTFSPAFARNVAYAWNGADVLKKSEAAFVDNKETNWILLKQIISTCKIIYGMIAFAVLLLLLSGGGLYIKKISSGLTDSYIYPWLVFVLGIFLNLYFGYYISLLRGVGATKIANQNQVISRILQIISTIALLFLGLGLIGASLGYLICGISYRLLSQFRFYNYRGIGLELEKIKTKTAIEDVKKIAKIIWYNTWREAIVAVSAYILGQAVTIFSSLYMSLTETGVYSLGVQFTNVIAQVSRSLSTTYLPEMQAAYINNKRKRLCEVLSGSVVAFVIIYLSGAIVVVSLCVPVLHVIKPDMTITRGILAGLFICQFINYFPYCYTAYFSATNRIIYYKSYLLAALLCIVSSFVFLGIFKLGIWGLLLAQLSSQLFYYFWIWIYKANKELNLNLKKTFSLGIIELSKFVRVR